MAKLAYILPFRDNMKFFTIRHHICQHERSRFKKYMFRGILTVDGELIRTGPIQAQSHSKHIPRIFSIKFLADFPNFYTQVLTHLTSKIFCVKTKFSIIIIFHMIAFGTKFSFNLDTFNSLV